VIWLHHFSWHVGSVAVLAMIGLFLLAVWQPSGFSVRSRGDGYEYGLCRARHRACDLWQPGPVANTGTLSLDDHRNPWGTWNVFMEHPL
jgi:hypothetical protein